MNRNRRKELADIATRIEEAKSILDELTTGLETTRDDEQDYYDNMPENFQSGEQGERAQAAIEAMTEAASTLETFLDEEIGDKIEEAQE